MTNKERYAPKIPFYPYLVNPISEKYAITEGYIYSRQERSIHGFYFHKGLDFDTRYGAPVYAAASGFAVAGYHRFTLHNSDYSIHLYKGKPLGFGQGYFVQIYHPEEICHVPGGRITQYGHLSSFDPVIKPKLLPPRQIDIIQKIYDKAAKAGIRLTSAFIKEQETIIANYPWVQWRYGFSISEALAEKESYLYSPADLATLAAQGSDVVWVEQGQPIGTVGNSAVIWGDLSYDENAVPKAGELIEPLETWDAPHLHFEEATRDWQSGAKLANRDPYDIYKGVRWYQQRPVRTLFKEKS